MNKQELLQKAKRNIDERRYKAEEQCDNTLITLRTNTEYRVSERNLRQAQVNYSMCNELRKSDLKKLLDQRKAEMMSVLTKLNVDEKTLRPQYACELCQDTGYINNAMCRCLHNEFRRLLTAESNVMNTAFTFENSSEKDKHNLAVYKSAKQACADGKNVFTNGLRKQAYFGKQKRAVYDGVRAKRNFSRSAFVRLRRKPSYSRSDNGRRCADNRRPWRGNSLQKRHGGIFVRSA